MRRGGSSDSALQVQQQDPWPHHLNHIHNPPAVRANNVAKAAVIYDAIAASNGFYNSPVAPAARSKMNVPFTIPSDADLEKAFVAEATAAGGWRLWLGVGRGRGEKLGRGRQQLCEINTHACTLPCI